MKVLQKILIIVVVAIAVMFLLTFIFFRVKGKDIVVNKLKESLGREVSIKDITVSFPLIVKVKNLEIPQLAKIDYLSVSTSVLGFLSGRIVLNNITLKNPSFMITRLEDGSFDLPMPVQKTSSTVRNNSTLKPPKNKPSLIPLAIDITGGKVLFKDKQANIENFAINAQNIDLHIAKASLLPNAKVKFRVSGIIYGLNPNKTGSFNTDGWVDFDKKDMDGIFKVQGGDCVLIIPYLGSFLPVEKIADALFNIDSTLKAADNNLVVDTNLELENLAKTALAKQSGDILGMVGDKVLDFLKDETDKASVHFIYKTKLDKPFGGQLDSRAFVEDIFQKKVLEPLTQGGSLDKLKKIGEDFKEMSNKFKKGF